MGYSPTPIKQCTIINAHSYSDLQRKMPLPRRLRESLLLLLCLLLAGGSFTLWALKGRAHFYPDAPQGEFACLSYTPRSDANQVAPGTSKAQIERDLRQLSTRTHCVRTYSVSNGLDQVPEVARMFNMRVLLGIWIGTNEQVNEYELTRAIDIANTHREVIDAVIVGNEVLLRREQTPAALSTMLKRVHEATQLPVTYADVWDFWVKNPQLAQDASFITIHILPYWEDQPVGINAALAHVQDIYAKVKQQFPQQRIYVGETGWPSAGRQREAAQPSLLNQARFTREFIAYASAHDMPYNFIEAYDQPWKRRLEGTVGGYWGLYDAQGGEKFPLTGMVIEDQHWWRGPLTGALFAALFVPLAWRSRSQGALRVISCLLAGFALGATMVLQWDYLLRANRSWQEWLASGAWTLCCDAMFVFTLLRLKIERTSNRAGFFRLQLALLLGAAYINVGLVFDARYRDFPSEFLALPAVMLAIGRLVYGQLIGNTSREQALFASWLLLSVAAIAINEGWRNVSALLWCGLCLLLAIATLPAVAQSQIQHRAQ